MEDLIKNIKKKLSVDDVVDFMKDGKVLNEESNIKEEDVRKTLAKVDPNNIMDLEEMSTSANNAKVNKPPPTSSSLYDEYEEDTEEKKDSEEVDSNRKTVRKNPFSIENSFDV